MAAPSKKKIAIIGSGNWGSAIAKIVAANTASLEIFDEEVKMWVFEEEFNGRKLSEAINKEHENIKYLPGIKLPENVVAVTDLGETVKDADMLVFVFPHQFLGKLLPTVKEHMRKDAIGISLLKGIDYDDSGFVLLSEIIARALDINVSVLMGANIADEVAKEHFCESTVGSRVEEEGKLWRAALDAPKFAINVVKDVHGVELCGALKNVVALGAGFCDGLKYGYNTKSAIMRIGLAEMIRFCKLYYKGVEDTTFMESCGIADLITTCMGGRNRKCAEAFAQAGGGDPEKWIKIEADLLGGQKIQGTLTAREVYTILKRDDNLKSFPLFTRIYEISFLKRNLVDITSIHDVARI